MAKVKQSELRIDKAGRIALPKRTRERLGLEPGTELTLIEPPDGVLIKRMQQHSSMIKPDGLWLHQGVAVRTANWDSILDDVRLERAKSTSKP